MNIRSLRLCSFFLVYYFLYCSEWVTSIVPSSHSFILSLFPCTLLLISSTSGWWKSIFLMWSDIIGERDSLLTSWNNSPSSVLFSDMNWLGVWNKNGSLGSPLNLCCQGRRWVYRFFPQCLARVGNYCLKVFCLTRLPFPVLCLARTGFWEGLAFLCACGHFQVAAFLSNHSGIYEATIKPKVLTTISFVRS